MLVGTECIILSVPSVMPDYAAGVIDEAKLDSLIGLDQDEVIRQIGWPDYSGPRGHSYGTLYQGEKRYSTDVYFVFVAPPNDVDGTRIDTGNTKVLYCQVLTKTAILESRAKQGDTQAAIELAG